MNLTSGLVFYNHLLTASFTNNTWHSCTIDSCKKTLLARNFKRFKLSSRPLFGHFVQFWSWSKVLKVLKEQKAHKIEISSSDQSIQDSVFHDRNSFTIISLNWWSCNTWIVQISNSSEAHCNPYHDILEITLQQNRHFIWNKLCLKKQ